MARPPSIRIRPARPSNARRHSVGRANSSAQQTYGLRLINSERLIWLFRQQGVQRYVPDGMQLHWNHVSRGRVTGPIIQMFEGAVSWSTSELETAAFGGRFCPGVEIHTNGSFRRKRSFEPTDGNDALWSTLAGVDQGRPADLYLQVYVSSGSFAR